VIAAYAFVWVALMAYLWSIWRRLGRVEAEMRTLEARRSRAPGGRHPA
jgi:CcmD family protein